MRADQLRRARNEALFREVNERIAELETGLTGYAQDDSLLVDFVCECPNEDCGDTLEVTCAQYEAVRSNPKRFLVVPGHEDAEVARVVERHAHFMVVEKLDEAAEIAIEQDPRA
jgi:hypothetical protein